MKTTGRQSKNVIDNRNEERNTLRSAARIVKGNFQAAFMNRASMDSEQKSNRSKGAFKGLNESLDTWSQKNARKGIRSWLPF